MVTNIFAPSGFKRAACRSAAEPASTWARRNTIAKQLIVRWLEPCLALGRAYRIKGWLREELQLLQRRAQVDRGDADASERLAVRSTVGVSISYRCR
jgi:hypothetical protein